MNKVKLQTTDVMPQLVAASAYRMAVNELFKKILNTDSCVTGYYIKDLIREFIKEHKEEA